MVQSRLDGILANNELQYKNYLNDEQRLNWLQLIRSENVGPITFKELINYFGSADRALKEIPNFSKKGGLKRKIKIYERDKAKKELEDSYKIDAKLVALGEPEYPPYLRYIHDAPPLIYMKGDFELVKKPIIAIVGSRNSSAIGIKQAQNIARELSDNGYIIASGLARGIDTAAHIGSLHNGTIAALAGGLNTIYPSENEGLFHEIGDFGILISEMPPNMHPSSKHFPRRNRIISGMSKGVLIVEAAKRSGSLITARLALEQSREVFAIPGSPLDPRSSGTNNLIKQGATLVTSSKDIIDTLEMGNNLFSHGFNNQTELNLVTQETSEVKPAKANGELRDEERETILNLLSITPTDLDDLITISAIPTNIVQAILIEYELAGKVRRHKNNMVSLTLK